MKIQGWDLSLNHLGVVQLGSRGAVTRFWFVTDKLGTAQTAKHDDRAGAFRLNLPKKADPRVREMLRLETLERFLRVVVKIGRPDYVGIESYALDQKQGAHQMGELGGIARRVLWRAGIPFREHTPSAVKKYACHDGTASKQEMVDAARDRWGEDFTTFSAGKDLVTAEDLSDALAVAHLVRTEVRLRSGHLVMSDLAPKEIEVFNAVSKRAPINVLARAWTARGELP